MSAHVVVLPAFAFAVVAAFAVFIFVVVGFVVGFVVSVCAVAFARDVVDSVAFNARVLRRGHVLIDGVVGRRSRG